MCVLSQIFVGPRSSISKKSIKRLIETFTFSFGVVINCFHKDFLT